MLYLEHRACIEVQDIHLVSSLPKNLVKLIIRQLHYKWAHSPQTFLKVNSTIFKTVSLMIYIHVVVYFFNFFCSDFSFSQMIFKYEFSDLLVDEKNNSSCNMKCGQKIVYNRKLFFLWTGPWCIFNLLELICLLR